MYYKSTTNGEGKRVLTLRLADRFLNMEMREWRRQFKVALANAQLVCHSLLTGKYVLRKLRLVRRVEW